MTDIDQLRANEAAAQRELDAAQQLVREAREQLRDRLGESMKLLVERERAFSERRRLTEAVLKREDDELRVERRELERQIDAVDELLHPPEPTRGDGEW